jgi:hypothetical protein
MKKKIVYNQSVQNTKRTQNSFIFKHILENLVKFKCSKQKNKKKIVIGVLFLGYLMII